MRHLLITTAIALCLISLGASASSDDARARTLDTLRDLDTDLTSLTKSHLAYEAKAKELAEAARKLNAAVEQSLKIAGGKKLDAEMAQSLRSLQDTSMSFNLQYLQLQSQMQNENWSYTAISNIMKTKHDTVKNSISNIR